MRRASFSALRLALEAIKSLHCSSFFFVNKKLYYGILTIKLVNQKKELQWRLYVFLKRLIRKLHL